LKKVISILFLVIVLVGVIGSLGGCEIDSDYTVYITESGSKYHKSGCQYLGESSTAILKSEAIEQGYTACSVCKP
jgi:hypothetical protein